MKDLLIPEKTQLQIQAFIKSPSHAVLLNGPQGSGKYTLARYLTANLLGIELEKLDDYAYFSHLSKPKDKQEISIDEVRKLASSLKLRMPGTKKVERVVLMENANNLSTEAQNALLKTLEEPYSSTIFIFTAPSAGSLLTTISSRLQHIQVLPSTSEDALSYFGSKFEEVHIKSNWQLSQGRIGLLSDLLEQGDEHELKGVVNEAKDFLKMAQYERILRLTGYDQSQLLLFLEAMSRILSALHRNALKANQTSAAKRILSARKDVEKALASLSHNASARLVALNVALNLKI